MSTFRDDLLSSFGINIDAITSSVELRFEPALLDAVQTRALRSALVSSNMGTREKASLLLKQLPQDQYEVVMFGERN